MKFSASSNESPSGDTEAAVFAPVMVKRHGPLPAEQCNLKDSSRRGRRLAFSIFHDSVRGTALSTLGLGARVLCYPGRKKSGIHDGVSSPFASRSSSKVIAVFG